VVSILHRTSEFGAHDNQLQWSTPGHSEWTPRPASNQLASAVDRGRCALSLMDNSLIKLGLTFV